MYIKFVRRSFAAVGGRFFYWLGQDVKYRCPNSASVHFALQWVEFVFFSPSEALAVVDVCHTSEMPKMSASLEAR